MQYRQQRGDDGSGRCMRRDARAVSTRQVLRQQPDEPGVGDVRHEVDRVDTAR
jgi:hypothetical protein